MDLLLMFLGPVVLFFPAWAWLPLLGFFLAKQSPLIPAFLLLGANQLLQPLVLLTTLGGNPDDAVLWPPELVPLAEKMHYGFIFLGIVALLVPLIPRKFCCLKRRAGIISIALFAFHGIALTILLGRDGLMFIGLQFDATAIALCAFLLDQRAAKAAT